MEPPIFIQIDENPNCAAMDGLVFQPKAPAREVSRVRVSRDGVTEWCEITGLTEAGDACPAVASPIDDSGDGGVLFDQRRGLGIKADVGIRRFRRSVSGIGRRWQGFRVGLRLQRDGGRGLLAVRNYGFGHCRPQITMNPIAREAAQSRIASRHGYRPRLRALQLQQTVG